MSRGGWDFSLEKLRVSWGHVGKNFATVAVSKDLRNGEFWVRVVCVEERVVDM